MCGLARTMASSAIRQPTSPSRRSSTPSEHGRSARSFWSRWRHLASWLCCCLGSPLLRAPTRTRPEEPSRGGRVDGYPSTGNRKETRMAAKEKTLGDLFEDTLKDIYYAENKILKALPKMAKAAQSDELKAAFEKQLKETEGQVSRLEKVFKLIDAAPKGKKCEAIEGIIEEGAEIMKEFKGAPALDA